ncbi:lipopolysaccharide heptosyltransferase I [Geobacter pickeringii]|uniref:Lipopolysaccharide heptosyltransferase 1 n=1 Tax=Geobacter pickeringii TaxID=345632 RepID=A0A0B5BEX8_9BACT|nr:lipopolysaccharide heptosyltransferase I [Geobacter pickeringii]AJE03704.1 ADP-heptose--LPS heptosyltransferase [Geobacter pickeringii]
MGGSSLKVLIVKVSALGDVVHALPVLDYLRQAVPGVEIDWVVEEGNREILDGHPLLHAVHVVRTKAWRRHPFSAETRREVRGLREAFRAASYDIAFDLQGNFKSGLITWLSGARRRYGFDREGVRESLNLLFTTNQVPLRRQDHHVSCRSLRVVSVPFGKDYTGMAVSSDIFTSPADDAAAEALLATLSDGFALLFHNGTTWTTKLWHEEGWIELGRRTLERFPDATILLSWGNEGERTAAESIARGIGRNVRILPRLSLKGFCAILKKVDLVVGGDTGPIHLAAAVGTPTVSFYRATDGRRNGPGGEQHVLVQSPLSCHSCLRKECDRDAECRRSIAAGQVLAGIERLLSSSFPSSE